MSLNVRDFGALGDGVHNDQPAIQATIASAREFDTVCVPQPVGAPPMDFYRIEESLEIKKSLAFVGEGILPRIKMQGKKGLLHNDALLTVNLSASSQPPVVLVDNFFLFGGLKGLDIRGSNLNRQSRFRNLRITGSRKVGIDIGAGMIGAEFENISIHDAPDYGIRCEDTGNIISVRFVTCRITGTRIAAMEFSNYGPAVHPISIISPVIEGNRGAGLVIRGGHLIDVQDAHFEVNGSEDRKPDLELGAVNNSICEVQMRGGLFSGFCEAQDPNRPLPRVEDGRRLCRSEEWQEIANTLRPVRVAITTDRVALAMHGTIIGNRIDANNHLNGVKIEFIGMRMIPEVINFPCGHLYTWPPRDERYFSITVGDNQFKLAPDEVLNLAADPPVHHFGRCIVRGLLKSVYVDVQRAYSGSSPDAWLQIVNKDLLPTTGISDSDVAAATIAKIDLKTVGSRQATEFETNGGRAGDILANLTRNRMRNVIVLVQKGGLHYLDYTVDTSMRPVGLASFRVVLEVVRDRPN